MAQTSTNVSNGDPIVVADHNTTVADITELYALAAANSDARSRAYRSGSTQSISASTNTELIFNSEDYDSGADYSTANGRFTAPATGTYLVMAGVAFTHSSGSNTRELQLRKNGTLDTVIDYEYTTVGDQAQMYGAALISLAAGDYISIWLGAGNAGTVDPDQNRSYFAVQRVQ